MPRKPGSKNKSKEAENAEGNRIPAPEKPEEKKAVGVPPLEPGQKYFEAPDGSIYVGPEHLQQLPHRTWGYINPKR